MQLVVLLGGRPEREDVDGNLDAGALGRVLLPERVLRHPQLVLLVRVPQAGVVPSLHFAHACTRATPSHTQKPGVTRWLAVTEAATVCHAKLWAPLRRGLRRISDQSWVLQGMHCPLDYTDIHAADASIAISGQAPILWAHRATARRTGRAAACRRGGS